MSRKSSEIKKDLDRLDADLDHLAKGSTIRASIEGRVKRAIAGLKAEAGESGESGDMNVLIALCGDDLECIAAQLRQTLLGD